MLVATSDNLSVFLSALRGSFVDRCFFFAPLIRLVLGVAPCLVAVLTFAKLCVSLPGAGMQFMGNLITKVLSNVTFRFFRFVCVDKRV